MKLALTVEWACALKSFCACSLSSWERRGPQQASQQTCRSDNMKLSSVQSSILDGLQCHNHSQDEGQGRHSRKGKFYNEQHRPDKDEAEQKTRGRER
eukprot:1152182-Pelagomonas_calceolata.AAC.5